MSGLIDLLENALKALLPAAIVLFGVWFKGKSDQKRRDRINELDLSSEKVRFNVDSKPLSDLVAESNKSHGAVVKPTGSSTEEK